MNSPSVSAIITVKNGEKYIASAINSILRQEYQPIEILVVDDNSTDKTLEIATSFPKVRAVDRKGTGIGNGWNTGIENASGELIAFLTHDDLWTPNKLKLQVAALEADQDKLFAVSRFEYFLEDENYIPPGFRPNLLNKSHIGLTPHTLVARPKVFDTVGLFDEMLTTGEDTDWFSRAKDLEVPYLIVPEVLLKVRIHKSNTSLNTLENDQNLLWIIKRSIERKKVKTMSSNG